MDKDWLPSVIERAKRAAELGPHPMLKGRVRYAALRSHAPK